MKAIVCQEPGRFELIDKPMPVMREGEVLLQVQKIGICGTDFHAYAGNQAFFSYPRILGHEVSAKVVDASPAHHNILGQSCMLMPYISCGQCVACRKGKTNCCSAIQVIGVHIDGAMQEYITVPPSLLLISESLSLDHLAIVEPLAIGAHAIRRAQLSKGETVAVVGAGPIGLGIMWIASRIGCTVIAIDTNNTRLQMAKEHFGAVEIMHSDAQTPTLINQFTNGDGCDAVFDATGSRIALESGINYMGHGGRYVLVGLAKSDLSFFHPDIHAKESSILCSRNATKVDFDMVIALLTQDMFPIESYITHHCHSDQMISLFDSWVDPKSKVIKALVEFSLVAWQLI